MVSELVSKTRFFPFPWPREFDAVCVAGGCGEQKVRREFYDMAIDAEAKYNVCIAYSVHEATGSCSCGRFVNQVNGQSRVCLEMLIELVAERGIRFQNYTRRVRAA